MSKRQNSVVPNGNILRDKREDKGLTQEMLAQKTGYSIRTIGRMEQGTPTYISRLKDVAEALDVDVAELILKEKANSLRDDIEITHKYFHSMRDVIEWDNDKETPQWFRSGGPIAADFKDGTVIERKELLKKLNELVLDNDISILEGNGGTGKSVLVRNFAYNLINTEKVQLIYHYSFKTDSQIGDLDTFLNILNNIDGIVIIEDIHLASTSDIQAIVNNIKLRDDSHLLLTARPSYKEHQSKYYSEKLSKLPTLPVRDRSGLGQEDDYSKDICKIIDGFVQKNPRSFQWADEIRHSVKNVAGDDLWLLSYVLKGCDGKGEAITWLKKGVMDDLIKIEKHYKCNPDILLALCPLYRNEVLTAKSFLTQTLGFDRKEINELVRIGEVIEHNIEDEIFYGLTHSSMALAYWEHGGEYRNCLKYPDYTEFIYSYAISGVSNGLRAVFSASQDAYFDILYSLLKNGDALKVFQTEQDKTQYMLLIRIFAYFLKHQEGQVLFSKEFIQGFVEILFKRGYFTELQFLIISSSRVPDVLKKISDYFISILYNKDFVGDVCNFISIISAIEKQNVQNFNIVIDCTKLASIVNSPGNKQLSKSIRFLISINESLAMHFCKELVKKYENLVWVKEWLEETYLYYDYLAKTHNLVFPDNKSNDELRNELMDIEDKICENRHWPVTHSELRLNILQYLFKVDRNLGIEFWHKLNKTPYSLAKNVEVDVLCSCLNGMSKLDEIIKSELSEIIDCEKLALNINQTTDIQRIYKALQSLFEVNRSIGLKLWKQISKELLVNEADVKLDSVCQCLNKMRKLDIVIASELGEIIDCEKLALKANQSTDILMVFSSLQSLFEINRSIGLKFWNKISKEHLVNGTDVKLESLCLCIKDISKFDKEIESDLCNVMSGKKLALKANQLADVSYVGQLFALLFNLNKKLGTDFWKELNKKDYAEKLYNSKIIDIFSSFQWVFDVDQQIAKDFWEQYIDVSTLAAKLIEDFHDSPFTSEIITYFCQTYPKGAKELCRQFDTAKLAQLLNKSYISSDRRMRTIIVFAAYGAKITEDYNRVISGGVEEYANTLMQEYYSGWNADNDKIAVMEPTAANMLYDHICNNVRIEKFIDNVKKSNSEELIAKCNVFFSTLDPDNKQEWRKCFDQ